MATAYWVRFERVGVGSKFDAVLDIFRQYFPFATWDDGRRAWLLPAAYLQSVQRVCSGLFGTRNVRIQKDSITENETRQMGLFREGAPYLR